MQLLITQCSDSMRWYSKHIGKSFLLIRNYRTEYLVLDAEGYTNTVLHADGRPVDDEENTCKLD